MVAVDKLIDAAEMHYCDSVSYMLNDTKTQERTAPCAA